jgi:hypothetical protein
MLWFNQKLLYVVHIIVLLFCSEPVETNPHRTSLGMNKYCPQISACFLVSGLFPVAHPTEISYSAQRPFLVQLTTFNLKAVLTKYFAFMVTLLPLFSPHISLHLYNAL